MRITAHLRSRLTAILRLLFWAALVFFVFDYFWPTWQSLQLSQRLTAIAAGPLLGALSLTIGHYLAVFAVWFLLLRLLEVRISLKLAYKAFALSLLPKYVPGRIVAHGVRAGHLLAAKVPGASITSSIVLEAVLGLGSAAVISTIALFYEPANPVGDALRWVVLAVLLVFAVYVGIGILPLSRGRWREWIGSRHFKRRPGQFLGLLGLASAVWLIPMAAHWFLANSFTRLPLAALPALLVAVAVSWAAGVISVVAPAGIGVREGVLYLFASNWFDQADALLFVTLSRLTLLAVEVLLTAAWGVIGLTHEKSPEGSEDPRNAGAQGS